MCVSTQAKEEKGGLQNNRIAEKVHLLHDRERERMKKSWMYRVSIFLLLFYFFLGPFRAFFAVAVDLNNPGEVGETQADPSTTICQNCRTEIRWPNVSAFLKIRYVRVLFYYISLIKYYSISTLKIMR